MLAGLRLEINRSEVSHTQNRPTNDSRNPSQNSVQEGEEDELNVSTYDKHEKPKNCIDGNHQNGCFPEEVSEEFYR